MPDASLAISREQRAAADFTDAISRIRDRFELPEDRQSIDALVEAALRFGACELRMRRADRLRTVGLHDAEASDLAVSAMAEHELGLAALPAVRPLIERLSRQKLDPRLHPKWREASPRLRREWRSHVAGLDVSTSEAQQLLKLADQACDVLDQDGLAGLGRYLSKTLDELEKARRSNDRGTHTASFPYWKFVMAAIFWGIGVGWTYDLVTKGAPWWAPFLVWLVVAVVTFMIALGCRGSGKASSLAPQ